jgi:hypothetical protein
MTSATTTPARGMGRRHAEGYGLIVFASILLLVPDDHRGRRSRAMGPVCLWQPREPGCLASLCVDRPQLAGIVIFAVLASVAMVIRYRSRSALWAIDRVVVLTGLGFVIASLNVAICASRTEFRDEFRLWRHLLVPATAAVLFLFPLYVILHWRAVPARAASRRGQEHDKQRLLVLRGAAWRT